MEASKDTVEHDNESQKATSHFVSEGLQPFEPILLELNENCNELVKETRRSDKAHTCHFTIRTERTRSRRHQTPHWPEQGPAWLKIGIRVHPAHNMFILCFQTALRHHQTKKKGIYPSNYLGRRSQSSLSKIAKIALANISAIPRLFTMKQAKHNNVCMRVHNQNTMFARAGAHSEHFPRIPHPGRQDCRRRNRTRPQSTQDTHDPRGLKRFPGPGVHDTVAMISENACRRERLTQRRAYLPATLSLPQTRARRIPGGTHLRQKGVEATGQ